jgi:hypothetical protein
VQQAQKSKQNAEVVADGGEHGIAGVAGAVSEVVASHAVLSLEMSDHGPERSPAARTRKMRASP